MKAKLIVVALFLSLPARAATHNAASCSVAHVNSAIANAASGDIVNVPPGNCVWNSEVRLPDSKGISLIGAGSTDIGTVITLNSTLEVVCSAGKPHRISGFKFKDKTEGVAIGVGGTCSGFRIDHNAFTNFANSVDAMIIDEFAHQTGHLYGLIDNNTFSHPSENFRAAVIIGHNTEAWPSAMLGTAETIFFEDNTLDFGDMTNAGAGCIDANYTGHFVWRHNSSRNCLVTAHGVCNAPGTVAVEIYENAFIANGTTWADGTRLIHHQGSGEAVIFNNTFQASSGKSEGAIGLTHYRSCPGSETGCEAYPRCNGGANIDGNRAPLATYRGYPCLHQPGRNAANALSPWYLWGNRWSDNGAKVSLLVENPWDCSVPEPATHLQTNRDFYDYVQSGFNGTSGTGTGPLASRPSSCSSSSEDGGGVGYWATDAKTLYRCRAANTWVAHYRPYTYPHPLREVSRTISSPSNMRIIEAN